MNVREAKEQIKNAVIAYRAKDAYGRPVISEKRQRPIFLEGAPGIGKTAIVEQVAKELGIGLVSYSITHHTRQSALGLPFIKEQEYDGKMYRISEYTMSEIIAAVYETMEETGVREGILFLDEINCASETLTPAMLQFLQYKVFGQHKVPEGWVIVTAGNPPEYNQSVREFDMVTSDRLKRIEMEADYATWRAWAANEGVHPAILSYLDIRKDEFYKAENTVEGRDFVTPRSWVDLSEMLKVYEIEGILPDELLVRQYLQSDSSAKQFTVYMELFRKYRSDYEVMKILDGTSTVDVERRARDAGFDERISLLGLLLDGAKQYMRPVVKDRRLLERMQKEIVNIRTEMETGKEPEMLIAELLQECDDALSEEKRSLLEGDAEDALYELRAYLEAQYNQMSAEKAYGKEALEILKNNYMARVQELNEKSLAAKTALENLFGFVERVFGASQEMLIVVTELTSDKTAARYISSYGCEPYFKYNKELLFYERSKTVLKEIDNLKDLGVLN